MTCDAREFSLKKNNTKYIVQICRWFVCKRYTNLGATVGKFVLKMGLMDTIAKPIESLHRDCMTLPTRKPAGTSAKYINY